MDDALRLMEEGQQMPDRPAPMLPPKVLGEPVKEDISIRLCDIPFVLFCFTVVSSSSDTVDYDFNHSGSDASVEVRIVIIQVLYLYSEITCSTC